jgi:gluconolactonase
MLWGRAALFQAVWLAPEELAGMDALATILESPSMERLATGFGFTEGPLWRPDGFLYFVDLRRSQLLRWQAGKGGEVVREDTGEGNGCAFDRQGRLLMCEGENRCVSRTEVDGRVVPLVERCSSRGSDLGRLMRMNW